MEDNMKPKKKRFPWKVIIIVVVVAAVLGGAAYYAMNRPRANLSNVPSFTVSTVTRGDIQVTVHGSGSLEPMDSTNVYVQQAGTVSTLNVQDGDIVKAGQVLAVLSDDSLNDQIDTLKQDIVTQDAAIAALMRGNTGTKKLTAPVDCRVKAIYAAEGQDVNQAMGAHNALMLLSTDGKLKIDFTPAEGAKLTSGQAVNVVVGSKKYKGFIASLPDGSTMTAQAQISDDSLQLNADATVQSTDGSKLGQGKLEVNRPLLLTAYSGTVDTIYVKVNDEVSAGHKLLTLDGAVLSSNFEAQLVKRDQQNKDLQKLYDDQAKLTVTAPSDGIVSGLTLTKDTPAQANALACTIQSKNSFKLVIAVDELDIPKVSVGQKATIKIDALPDAQVTGEVTRISPIGTKSNDVTTYDVTLKVNAPDGTLSAMNSSADIEVALHTNALLVPVEAVQTVNGKTYVYVVTGADGNAVGNGQAPSSSARPSGNGGNNGGGRMGGLGGNLAGGMGNFTGANRNARNAALANIQRARVDVTVGLINDTQAEILDGLKEGDHVAVPEATTSSANGTAAFLTGGGNGGGQRVQVGGGK